MKLKRLFAVPCVGDFFGMYNEDGKPVLYCRGLVGRSSTIFLRRIENGVYAQLLHVEHGIVQSSSAALMPRVSVNTSHGHRTEVIVKYNTVQCEDNTRYMCEVHQSNDGHSEQASVLDLMLYREHVNNDKQLVNIFVMVLFGVGR